MPETPLNLSPLDLRYVEPPLALDFDAASIEDRLDRLSIVVNHAKYEEAAPEAEAMLGEGVRDVRLVHPYLFGCFLNQGLHVLPTLFTFITQLLTSHWNTFGPEDQKTVFLESGLRSLFKTLYRHMESHSRSKEDPWKEWCGPANRAPLQEALELVPEMAEALNQTLPGHHCDPPLRQLVTWLEAHLATLPQEPEPRADAPEDAPEPDEDTPGEEEAPAAAAAPERAPAAARAPSAPPAAVPSIPISPALALLQRKLDAFDSLVERKDLVRASVVAADVLNTLDHFDPRVYLPTLFSRFFSGLSLYADSIERLLQGTDSLAFRSLEQLYRVDLNAFLEQPQRDAPLE